ncbi:MAG: O-antigen ligase family protein [Solirubrobacterales bacterium]
MWILAAAFFFMPLNALRLTGGLAYGDIFAVLAFGVAALLLLTKARPLPKLPVWLWAGGMLLVLSMLIVQMFPPDSLEPLNISFPDFVNETSASTGVKLLGALIVIPLVVAIVVDSWKAVGMLINAWLAGVTVSCAVALSDAYLGTGLQLGLAFDQEMSRGFIELLDPARHFGLTVHPNALTLTAMLSIPLLLAKMTDPRRLMIFFPVLLLLLLGIVLSGSRIGVVGFALGLVLTLAVNPEFRKTVFTWDPRVALTLVVGFLVSMLLLFVVPLHSFSLDETQKNDGPAGVSRVSPDDSTAQESDALRRQYFEDSVEYIKERPLVGYGFQWSEASHNIYLQMPLAGGILALVGFLTVMLGYLRQGWVLRDRVPAPVRGICLALGISVAVYLVTGVLGNGVLSRYLYLAPALLLSITLMLSRRQGQSGNAQSSEP